MDEPMGEGLSSYLAVRPHLFTTLLNARCLYAVRTSNINYEEVVCMNCTYLRRWTMTSVMLLLYMASGNRNVAVYGQWQP
jgi:hypothetical protein